MRPGAGHHIASFVIRAALDSAVGCALSHLGDRRQTQGFQTGRVRGDAGKLGSHTHNVRGDMATRQRQHKGGHLSTYETHRVYEKCHQLRTRNGRACDLAPKCSTYSDCLRGRECRRQISL